MRSGSPPASPCSARLSAPCASPICRSQKTDPTASFFVSRVSMGGGGIAARWSETKDLEEPYENKDFWGVRPVGHDGAAAGVQSEQSANRSRRASRSAGTVNDRCRARSNARPARPRRPPGPGRRAWCTGSSGSGSDPVEVDPIDESGRRITPSVSPIFSAAAVRFTGYRRKSFLIPWTLEWLRNA